MVKRKKHTLPVLNPGFLHAIIFLVLSLWHTAAASSTDASDVKIKWFILVTGLLGGLSLFLFGMDKMGEALKAVSGDRLRDILATLSKNRIMGLITGTVVTAVIQSSSVTTVMLVGFVSANLMSFSQSIAIILGADIGTTITAQIVAFKVTKYALLLVSIGFGMLFISKVERVRQYGYITMGLGLIFFGMSTMSEAMHPLRTFQPFLKLMAQMSNPVLGILAATVFTALIQSSSATMGVVIVLAMQGLITLEAGIALALGANIGTCATAGLAALGKPREAVRVAAAHVFFKILGVCILLPWIPQFAELVRSVSPTGKDLAAAVPRQVANAHTFFNIGIALVFLPFIHPFARLIIRLVPDQADESENGLVKTKYLNQILLKAPILALDASRKEILRIGKIIQEMLDWIIPAVIEGTGMELDEIQKSDERVDALHGQIVTFLGEVSKQNLNHEQMRSLMHQLAIVNSLENIGDIIETDLVMLGHERIEMNVHISPETSQKLMGIHEIIRLALKESVDCIAALCPATARKVLGYDKEIHRLVKKTEWHQTQRLIAEEPGRLPAYQVETDVVDKLKRIHYHIRKIAKKIISEGDAPTRWRKELKKT